MDNNSPTKAILVVATVALIVSSVISSAVVVLRPIQLNNQLLEKSENVMQLTGLLADGVDPDDDEMLRLFRKLDARVLDVDTAEFSDEHDPNTFDQRRAVNDPELSAGIPSDSDSANLGRRSRFVTIYLVWEDGEFQRIILPVRGAGMWSMMYGYVALESDLTTIAAATFYEHAETPGLGDQIMRPDWLAQWQGRRIYAADSSPRFSVSRGTVAEDSSLARYEVDGLTGATVTANGVTNLIHYWFGMHGYQPFLEKFKNQPPTRPPETDT
jgi:Na+-transporting NADH:ubiquinone oxidoreductase subunit C